MFCSLAVLHMLNCVTENMQVTGGRRNFPRWPHVGQPCCTEPVETARAPSRTQFPEISPYICPADLRTFTPQLYEYEWQLPGFLLRRNESNIT
jgi:hypothetical protein